MCRQRKQGTALTINITHYADRGNFHHQRSPATISPPFRSKMTCLLLRNTNHALFQNVNKRYQQQFSVSVFCCLAAGSDCQSVVCQSVQHKNRMQWFRHTMRRLTVPKILSTVLRIFGTMHARQTGMRVLKRYTRAFTWTVHGCVHTSTTESSYQYRAIVITVLMVATECLISVQSYQSKKKN